MPQLNEILDNKVKKFVKRSYRPWDLSGNFDSEKNSNIVIPTDDYNENKTENGHKPNTVQSQTEHNSVNTKTQPGLNPDSTIDLNDITSTKENIQTQTDHKQHTKPDTESYTNGTQALVAKTQNEHKPDMESNTSTLKIKTQTAHKLDTNLSFASLSGIQRNIVVLIFNHCKIAKQDSTNEISISYISASLNIRIGSVKNSISRLTQKNFVIRLEYKIGRGGWSRYKLSNSLHSELLYLDKTHKLDTNHTQFEHKPTTEPYTEQYTIPASSSSLNKLTTNANIEETFESFAKNTLPPEWETIDISPLESIGFNINKLQQIYQSGKLTPEMVQDSIHAYAFDRDMNQVQHNSPISFIMSLLKVKAMPYEFPQNYESPKDRALRRYLEQKKAQRERAQQLQDLLKQDAFEEWLTTLTTEIQEEIIPVEQYAHGTKVRQAALMNYYDKNIWPEKEHAILAMSGK